MPRIIEGELRGEGLRFALVVSRFNDFITARLLDGAASSLRRHGVKDDDLDVVWVPGAMELALGCQRAARSGRYDAIVALGAVIRGGTPHFDHVCASATSGINRVALDTGLPVAYGVLTCDTIDQAIERAGTKAGNKGSEAAMAGLEMATLLRHAAWGE
jgi:6,7-dimethyl-8-ribityllumazine synthase